MDQTAKQPNGVRARRRAEVEQRLVDVGRRHLATYGAAGLTVRGVARDLDMAPSALFRYIAGRDDLLTTLIVACYDELGERAEAAFAAVPPDDAHGRWWAVAHACRDWARDHPHDWALLFGSPVPAYDAPAERTNQAGTRVTALLVRLGLDAGPEAFGDPVLDDQEEVSAAAVSTLMRQGFAPGLSPQQLLDGITAWTILVGAVSAEVFELVGDDVGDLDARFDYVAAIAERVLFGRG